MSTKSDNLTVALLDQIAQLSDRSADLLEQILKVVAIQAADGKSLTDGARALKLAGLDNQTIALALNTTPGTVRSVTANLRVKTKKRTRG